MATPQKTSEAAPAPAAMPRAYDKQRLEEAEHNQGPRLVLTLPGSETVPEGAQDVNRWSVVGPELHLGQHIELQNDDRSWFCLCRVEFILGGRGVGLRELRLRYLVPPQLSEREAEPPVGNGTWHIHYLGSHRKWAIIHPNGSVRAEGIASETEARNRCIQQEQNSGVYRR